ncbi:MAG: glycosyltransferase [Flavobacterium sp.]|nr:MAG: glycosyltransferase [Flavobacterium sp.]
METKPLYSIVTVVYNGAEHIEKTILSVIRQNFSDKQFIVIDGGSTDGTLDIIQKYKDKIDYFSSERDNGIFDAMNKAIEVCNGRYIAFLNAGDYYEPNVLSNLSVQLSNADKAGVVYGNTNLIIALGQKRYSTMISPRAMIDDQILIGPMFCHQSSFVKRELFDDFGGFENVGITGDWLYFVKLYNRGIIFKYVDITIANYLEGGASTTAAGFKESFEYKKKFGTFRFRDNFKLLLFYIKNFQPTKVILNLILWKTKMIIHKNKYTKLDDE